MAITLTDAAVGKIKEYLAGHEDLALRIYVSAGGCSGYSYGMALDQSSEEDHEFDHNGVRVLVDPKSLPFLEGIAIDYVESFMGGGFSIENPNAVSSCGCGSSFRVEGDGGSPAGCAH
ncbi:MAG: iron-sulfur cluster assembly accessory protein [Thermaerobacter sp.]|nr:iron-sulfur cluster assembly accessory protein [Thermaerobacter sp.]